MISILTNFKVNKSLHITSHRRDTHTMFFSPIRFEKENSIICIFVLRSSLCCILLYTYKIRVHLNAATTSGSKFCENKDKKKNYLKNHHRFNIKKQMKWLHKTTASPKACIKAKRIVSKNSSFLPKSFALTWFLNFARWFYKMKQ